METLKLKDLSFEARCAAIAQVVHAANRQYVEFIGGRAVNPTWEQIREPERQGLIKAVIDMIKEPKTPATSHEAWCVARKADGWSKDKTYSHARKTHPNLVPYAQLPFEEQFKDHLFMGIASIFVAGLEMYKMIDVIEEHTDSEVVLKNQAGEVITGEDEVPVPEQEEYPDTDVRGEATENLPEPDEVPVPGVDPEEGRDPAPDFIPPPLPDEKPTEDLTDTEKADTGNNDTLKAASAEAVETATAPPEGVDKSSTEAKAPAVDGEKVETAKAPKKKSKPKGSK